MGAQPVRSPRNARLKAVRAVRAGKERAHVLLEGRHLLAEARAAQADLLWVLHDEDDVDDPTRALLASCAEDGVELCPCPRRLLDPLSDLDSPRGLIALARRPSTDREALLLETARTGGLLLVAAGVQDPGNVGALVRVAAGLGASGLVALKGSASPWHPRALRGASGTTFRLPVAEGWEVQAFAQDLLDRGIELWCADPSGRDLRGCDPGGSLALVVGEEGRGVPETLLQSCTEVVAIPLQRGIESLNVATAAAVLSWELRETPVSERLFDEPPGEQDPAAPRRDAPLAERLRPQTLEELVGQDHLLGPGRPLRRAFDQRDFPSMILWGPPGTGKTTLARLIARHAEMEFKPFSAVLTGIKDVRNAMNEAERLRRARGRRTLLFVDEIHRFNKAQQDAFLPFVERGDVVLIGATTENPSFEVIGPLLSRVSVHVLQPLGEDDLVALLERALADRERGLGARRVRARPEQLRAIARFASGDGRRALVTLEAAARMGDVGQELRDEALEAVFQGRALLYDKSGEQHYDLISALHKSIRSSDPDAALYWLARMVEGGEDRLYLARRLVRIASEDVGLADPNALRLAVAARDAYHFLGDPEGELALAQLAVYLAVAPKSDAVYTAWGELRGLVRKGYAHPVPMQLRNAPTRLMKEGGWGHGYEHAHQEADALTAMECLPDALSGQRFYRPTERGWEARVRERLEAIRARILERRREGREE